MDLSGSFHCVHGFICYFITYNTLEVAAFSGCMIIHIIREVCIGILLFKIKFILWLCVDVYEDLMLLPWCTWIDQEITFYSRFSPSTSLRQCLLYTFSHSVAYSRLASSWISTWLSYSGSYLPYYCWYYWCMPPHLAFEVGSRDQIHA